ncbi:MAG TPA: hypothetical protein VFH24_07340 [Gemmatimonadales bacterium]|nr:hypothetical protein [Gemmatimonadales bacterium]
MILRPARLAAALARDELSQGDKLTYLLVWAVTGLVISANTGTWEGWTRLRITFETGSLLITVAGILACFQANARGDNRAFLERFLCLSVPIGLVTHAAYYGIYYALGLIGLALGLVRTDASNWDRNTMGLVSSFSALILYYVWMRASIARAAGVRDLGPASEGGA